MNTHLDDLTYDYNQIADPTLRTLAQRAADDIKPRLRRATEDILIIGARLATVRQYLPHGQWMDWLDAEFEMGDDTARHFINVASRFDDKSRIIRNLKPTALYALAAPSTPDDAITQVEALITNGHTPTVAETKQIIAEHKPGKPLMQVMSTQAEQEITSRIAAADEAVAAPDMVGSRWGALAAAWLRNHRDNTGRVWADLTDTQILHANAPWHQDFIRDVVREYPEMPDVKAALREGLSILRLHRAANPTPDTGRTPATQSPNHPITPLPSPTDNKALSPDTPSVALVEPAPARPPTRSSSAVHFTSDSEEHYTPDIIWQAAQRVMGVIVLDPCSNSADQPNIPALRQYTIDEDGLRQYWEGTVFMNPPYGRQIGEWITKLVEAHKTFDVPQAIALLPARVDTQWWQIIRDYPVCFVTGRLKFKGNDDNAAPFPSAVIYLGQRVDKFVNEFAPIGDIWRRIQ